MRLSFVVLTPFLVTAAHSSPLAARADGYCNTAINMVGQEGFLVKYPALSSGGTCIMKNGAAGAGVKTLQTALNNCYGANLEVDGDYGAKTTAAVKKAQGKIGGLDKDGVWGPKTGAKIEWWGSKKVSMGTITLNRCVKV